jgi:cytochrome c oxidase subunit 2
VSQTALVITVSYIIVCVIGAALAVAVWSSTRRPDDAIDAHGLSRRETAWLVIMVVALFALLAATIFYVPYGESAGPNRQVVRVTGIQFAWAISPAEVRAGTPVEFVTTTDDVNHGFGLYDPDGALLTQVQVIPGRVQKLVWTFDEPGTYEILCLEFCGAKHHEMVSTLEVLPA